MKYSDILTEEDYFPVGRINPTANYYGVSLFSDDGIESYYDVHCTLWTGFTDMNGKHAELRRADILRAERYAFAWKETGQPFSVVNTINEHIHWFFRVGGHALIEASVAKELIPWVLEPSPAFVVGAIGFTDATRIPRTAFNRAPTSKLRMRVVERDLYRCLICGRRPADYVDIELHVHHIRPFGESGLTIEENLITLCHTCHAGLAPHYRPQLYELVRNDADRPVFPSSSSQYLTRVGLYQKAIRRDFEDKPRPRSEKKKRA